MPKKRSGSINYATTQITKSSRRCNFCNSIQKKGQEVIVLKRRKTGKTVAVFCNDDCFAKAELHIKPEDPW